MIATANGRERRAAMPAKLFEQSGQEVKTLYRGSVSGWTKKKSRQYRNRSSVVGVTEQGGGGEGCVVCLGRVLKKLNCDSAYLIS